METAIRIPTALPPSSGSAFGDEIRALREKLALTQEQFSRRFGIPLSNLRNWEQASRDTQPDSAGRLLIRMIKVDPEGVARLVERATPPQATSPG